MTFKDTKMELILIGINILYLAYLMELIFI